MAEKPMRPRAPSETFLRDAQAAKAVRDKLRFVLEYGVLAPGGHPWMISVGDTAIDLRLGHRCERAAHDRLHRDAIIGCGIGLAQLKLALRQLGCVDSTIPLPEETQPDLLARVYIDHVEDKADPQSFVLYQALYTPVSKVPRAIDAGFQEELSAHAQFERALLSFTSAEALPPSDMAAPCGAPMLGSVVRRLAWMESRGVQPGGVTEVGGLADLSFEGSIGAVIATKEDKVADWLAAGQALARVALRARVEGFFTHVERAAHGARVEGGAYAQIALRIGVPRGYGGTAQAPSVSGHFFSGGGSGRGEARSR
jgi:hypothetical protein